MISCNDGETCPTGMECFANDLCVWLPEVGFADCINEDAAVACLDREECALGAQGSGVCATTGCTDTSECPLPPPGGDALVACLDVNEDGIAEECGLDCGSGQTCPDGMECTIGGVCTWRVNTT